MTTISGAELKKLIDLLIGRNSQFYHACQLIDFETYLILGGVPSRNLMERNGLPYTRFDTDEVDRSNAVWDLVFGNLQDHGFSFAFGGRNESTAPTPNPYGPILLVFRSEVLSEAENVAICLRSAGAKNFNRDRESLSGSEQVNRIFQYEEPSEAHNDFARANIAFVSALRQRFGNPAAQSPELSCVVENELLSFRWICRIVVDPYAVGRSALVARVHELKDTYPIPGLVFSRSYKEGESRFQIVQELADALLEAHLSVPQIIADKRFSDDLRDWANRLQNGQMEFYFERFAKYLRAGTLLPLQGP